MLRSPEYDDTRLAVLLEHAKQRSRALRHRQRVRRCLSGAAALVLVAGLAGGLVLARANGNSSQQIQTAAFVIRVKHALASQAKGNTVEYVRTVNPRGSHMLLGDADPAE